MGEIKAIETRYAGCRFRSRLEARWAVFFDALRITWEYEPEGYKMPDGTYYLPDFWLPDYLMFAEVKAQELTAKEAWKAGCLEYPCIELEGTPAARAYYVVQRRAAIPWSVYPAHDFDSGLWAVCLADSRRKSAAPANLRFWCLDVDRYREPDADCRGCSAFCAPAVVAARSARFEHGESG